MNEGTQFRVIFTLCSTKNVIGLCFHHHKNMHSQELVKGGSTRESMSLEVFASPNGHIHCFCFYYQIEINVWFICDSSRVAKIVLNNVFENISSLKSFEWAAATSRTKKKMGAMGCQWCTISPQPRQTSKWGFGEFHQTFSWTHHACLGSIKKRRC